MIIPVGFAQANFFFGGTGAPLGAQITLGLDVRTFSGSPTDAAQSCRTAWVSAQMNGMQTNDVTLESIMVKFGPNSTGPSGVYSQPSTGLGASESVAPNTAWLVRKTTDFGGRAGRGRFYVPGVADDAIDNGGNVDSTTLQDQQDRVDAFLVELTADLLIPVLLHGADSPLEAPSPIQAFVVDSKVATQRRRLRR